MTIKHGGALPPSPSSTETTPASVQLTFKSERRYKTYGGMLFIHPGLPSISHYTLQLFSQIQFHHSSSFISFIHLPYYFIYLIYIYNDLKDLKNIKKVQIFLCSDVQRDHIILEMSVLTHLNLLRKDTRKS